MLLLDMFLKYWLGLNQPITNSTMFFYDCFWYVEYGDGRFISVFQCLTRTKLMFHKCCNILLCFCWICSPILIWTKPTYHKVHNIPQWMFLICHFRLYQFCNISLHRQHYYSLIWLSLSLHLSSTVWYTSNASRWLRGSFTGITRTKSCNLWVGGEGLRPVNDL